MKVNYSLNNEFNPNHSFGNANDLSNCKDRVEKYFVFKQNNVPQLTALKNMLNDSIPDGLFVLVYTWGNLDHGLWPSGLDTALMNLGASAQITNTNTDTLPYIFFVLKGLPATALERYGTSPFDVIQIDTNVFSCTYIGVKESKLLSSKVSIYPNPATNKFTVSGIGNYPAEISLFDITGRVVKSEKVRSEKEEISVSHLPTGIYLYQIKTPEGKTHRGKLVKH